MLFCINGFENVVHCAWPVGQATVETVNAVSKVGSWDSVTNPAGRKEDLVIEVLEQLLVALGNEFGSQPGGGTVENEAPEVSKSTPADDVVSFEATVLLLKLTRTALWSETPPPVQPATLLAMMLLVTVIPYQFAGLLGLRCTSVPLMCCNRIPPPLPLSAVLPTITLLSITVLGPTPSESCGGHSTSFVSPQPVTPSGPKPMTTRPPPCVVSVGFKLWLNTIQLCEIVPL